MAWWEKHGDRWKQRCQHPGTHFQQWGDFIGHTGMGEQTGHLEVNFTGVWSQTQLSCPGKEENTQDCCCRYCGVRQDWCCHTVLSWRRLSNSPCLLLMLFAGPAGQRAAHCSGLAWFWSVLMLDSSTYNSVRRDSAFVCSASQKDKERSPYQQRLLSIITGGHDTALVQFHNQYWAQLLQLAKLLPGVLTHRPDPPCPICPKKFRENLQILRQPIFYQCLKSLGSSGVKNQSAPFPLPSPTKEKKCCYR